MTRIELQRVRDWADQKISTGAEPPWAWFQYMKLRENLDQILLGLDATHYGDLQAEKPEEATRPGSGHLRLVSECPQDSAQPGPSDDLVLPM